MAFKVNLIPNREFTVIHLNQYEYGVGNTRTVAIYNGDVPFDIPSGSDVTIEGVKPDGNAFAYNEGITFEDNEVTFELQDQMTVLAGQFPVEIVIRNSQGRWSTKNLIFDVEAGPVNENTPISDEDIPAYIDLAQRNANRAVSAAETATSAATTATTAANTATSKATIATTAATTATTAANTATSKASTATEAASTATTAAANAKVSEDNAKVSEEIAKDAADDVRPIITEVGSVVTTENAKPEKLFYLKADLEPEQNLNGYDHPWVGGAGKNLLPVMGDTATSGGITYTYNDDGTVTATGTATGNISSNYGHVTLPAGTYLVSGCTGGSSAKYRIRLGIGSYDGKVVTQNYDNDTEFTLEEATDVYARLYVGVAAGENVNITFKPMIRLATETDATYEPYENICPISGYDSLTVTRTGKNLIPNQKVQDTNTRVRLGESTVGNGFFLKAGTYKVSFELRTQQAFGIYWRTYKDGVRGTVVNSDTITISEDIYVQVWLYASDGISADNVLWFQLELGSVATTYEPYNGATYQITFPAEAGTVYGGTLTVNADGSGTLVVDRKVVNLSSSMSWTSTGSVGTNFRIYTNFADHAPQTDGWEYTDVWCSHLTYLSGNAGDFGTFNYTFAGNFSVKDKNGVFGTKAALVQWLDDQITAGTPVQVMYPVIATTYALSAVEVVQMLEDKNTIWTDNSDHIEISYRNISKLNDYLDTMRGVSYDDITEAGTVTETGTKVVDAVQLNPNVNGTIAKRLDAVETVASAAIPKTSITRTAQSSTGSKVVDAYELNASKSGTLAKKISDNTTNITTNTNALNGFKFGFTSDTPPKPGYIVPGGADTVIPFKTGGIVLLGSATQTFSQNTVVTLASDVDLSEYTFLGIFEDGSAASHPYNTMEYSIGSVVHYRTHYHTDNTNQDPRDLANPQFSLFIPVSDLTDTVTITVKNTDGNTPAFTGTITLYGFKGEIET